MTKYRVYGTTTVSVVKEVWANSEDEAYDRAQNELDSLTEYCGNGGYDKLVGVDGEGESVAVYDAICYDEIEVIDEDPDYFECPNCDVECDVCESEDGTKYFCCVNCGAYYDEDGNEFEPYEEEEE
jgi:hypothetical protein